MRSVSMGTLMLLVGCAAAATTQTSCSLLQPGPNGEPAPIQRFAASVAPILPGPWGAIAAAGATALVGVGSIFAKRQVNAAYASGNTDVTVNPVSKLLAERKFVLPILAAIPAIGSGFNLWDVSTEAMIATGLAALVGVGADVYEKKVTSPATAQPTP